jgi:hypothetical protein
MLTTLRKNSSVFLDDDPHCRQCGRPLISAQSACRICGADNHAGKSPQKPLSARKNSLFTPDDLDAMAEGKPSMLIKSPVSTPVSGNRLAWLMQSFCILAMLFGTLFAVIAAIEDQFFQAVVSLLLTAQVWQGYSRSDGK